MDNKNVSKHPLLRHVGDERTLFLPGYLKYDENEDIYIQGKEEAEIDPEQVVKTKENETYGASNEKSFDEDASGYDLDVPGSELDDHQEEIGSEDEENNYYSIGGDDHDNLDENSN
jgi:hypothetical protein